MKTKILSAIASVLLLSNAYSQEVELTPFDTLAKSVTELQSDLGLLKKIKLSGYMQAQYQFCDSNGVKSYAGGDFPANNDKRFTLRRARLKATYNGNFTQYVFQIDANEKGFSIKDMYAKVTEPWLQTVSLTFGCQNRPFGNEIGYSSSMRESPERGRMSQVIFPGERDLGAMLTFQLPKTSRFNFLKLEAGLFNGTGPGTVEFDKQKDIIGHLSMNKSTKNEILNFGAGVSYYKGGWRQGNKFVWEEGTINTTSGDITGFVVDSTTTNLGQYNKREYIGVDLQLNIDLPIGLTTFRAEYIQGTQPGIATSSASPSAQPTADTYIRNFNGAYFYFVQNIMQTKFQVVVKYDWYDPNIKVSGKDIVDVVDSKKTKLSSTDIMYSTLGLGFAYKWDENIKLTAYYDMVQNETTKLKGYTKDLPDNVLTIRMQYKF